MLCYVLPKQGRKKGTRTFNDDDNSVDNKAVDTGIITEQLSILLVDAAKLEVHDCID